MVLLKDGSKELVITSHGQPNWYEFIVEFVRRAPEIPHWRIPGLKPPRGFGFSVASIPGIAIQNWNFVPLKSNSEFAELGLPIEVSRNDHDLVDGSTVASILDEGFSSSIPWGESS